MGFSRPAGGLFLAFEGVEGSGKTTQVARLRALLEGSGVQTIVAREPGSTPLGERIRALVLDAPEMSIPAGSELYLMLAARAAFVEQVVRPQLAAGKVVIADRFELSTLAYQGAGRGLPAEEIMRSNRFATNGLSPDATILLDLDPAEGARRQVAAAKSRDRLEREGAAFHERVAMGYTRFAREVRGLIRVDATGTVEEVGERIVQALSARFPETFAGPGFITRDTLRSGSGPEHSGPQAVVEDE